MHVRFPDPSVTVISPKRMSYKHFSRVSHDLKRCGGNKSLLMFCCHRSWGLLKSLFLYFHPGMNAPSIWVNKWLYAFIDIFVPFNEKAFLSLAQRKYFIHQGTSWRQLNSFDDEKSHWLILQELFPSHFFLIHAEALYSKPVLCCVQGNPHSISWNVKVLRTLMYWR